MRRADPTIRGNTEEDFQFGPLQCRTVLADLRVHAFVSTRLSAPQFPQMLEAGL